MIISFAGHSHIVSSEQVKKIVKEQIRNNIKEEDTISFYLGGYGAFDEICACDCRELKQELNGIEIVYIAPL